MPSNDLVEFCRELRRRQTLAESILWGRLRNKQLGGLKFRRQHPFEGFILDFFCHEAQLGIELDGSVHRDREVAEHDRFRTEILEDYGIHILRIWNSEVEQDVIAVTQRILAVAKKRIEVLRK